MAHDIQVNQQVEVRRKIRNGTLVRIGSVVSIDQVAQTAQVHCPAELQNLTVPLDGLIPTSLRFRGVARRTLNPFAPQVQQKRPARPAAPMPAPARRR